MHHLERLRDILDFWFLPENEGFWFSKSDKFDQIIRNKFFASYEFFLKHDPMEICDNDENYLALIILYDQFPRNMFRNDPKSFATDKLALDIADYVIEKGIDIKIDAARRRFIYMPFMHSESLSDQERSLELFKGDGNSFAYAKAHYDIIKKFGHFPHRNSVLGRESTKEEIEFLQTSGSSF